MILTILTILAEILYGLFQGFIASIIVLGLLYVPGVTFFLLAKKLRGKNENDKQNKK